MKLSKDIATGTIAGAIGFFASRMPGVNPITQSLASVAITGFSTSFLYQHPLFNSNYLTQNHYALIAGTLIPLGIGMGLQYGVGVESYITNPIVLIATLLTNHLVSLNNQDQNVYTQLRDWSAIQLESWNKGLHRVELERPINYGTSENPENPEMYVL